MPSATQDPSRTRQRPGWELAGAGALLALLWAARRAPLGTPVADDYDFLHWLRFHRTLGWFDAMGGSPYWRPLSRQLYYALLAPPLLHAPWLVGALHLLLFGVLGLALFRAARHAFAAPVAAAIAAFPALAEPARTLLTWPSGGEPLLAMTAIAIAIDAALRDRRVLAIAATLAAALCYEQALIAVPVLVLIAWRRCEIAGGARTWTIGGALAAAAFLLGHALARAHGAGLFVASLAPAEPAQPLSLMWSALRAQLDVEDLRPPASDLVLAADALLVALACLALRERRVRRRIAERWPLLAGGAAWFALGMFAVALASPGWFPWRSMLPALGLALALVGFLGLASPRLAAAFVAMRLVALLLAPVVPAGVEGELPRAASSHSFVRIARLQRVVASARAALLARYPVLPQGASVRYWALPERTLWGFDHGKAPAVWYGDEHLLWAGLEDLRSPGDAVLAFNPDSAAPAVILEPAALGRYVEARDAIEAGSMGRADSLLAAAVRAQPRAANAFRDELARRQARVARARGDRARADSLNRLSWALGGESADYLAMGAMLALDRGDVSEATSLALRCTDVAPGDTEAIGVLTRLPGAPVAAALPAARAALARAALRTRRRQAAPGAPGADTTTPERRDEPGTVRGRELPR